MFSGIVISVIIPCYNSADFLHTAMRSVVSQGARITEIIVVDDGSTDETPAVVNALQKEEPRLRYIKQENQGPAAARNHGITAATNELIALLDADDTWPKGIIDWHYTQLQQNEAALLSLGLVQCLKQNGSTDPAKLAPYADPFKLFLFGAGLFRRSAFETIGWIDEQLRQSEDVDWFLRLRESKQCFLWNAETVALHYHLHGANLSGGDLRTKQSAFIRALKKSLDRRRAQS